MSLPSGPQSLDPAGIIVATWTDLGHDVLMMVGPSATPAQQLPLNRAQQQTLAAVLYGHYTLSTTEPIQFGSTNTVPLDWEQAMVVYWQNSGGGNLTLQPQDQPTQAVVLTPVMQQALLAQLIVIFGTPQYPDPTAE